MAGLSKDIRARVDEDQKKRFIRKAKTLNMTESELLREIVLAVIDQNNGIDQPIEPDAENAEAVRVTLRMPRFLREGVELRAKLRGMEAVNRWITALIQSNLTRNPVMTDEEIRELKTSNRELAAIGRNINQIAKALNRDSYDTEQVRLDKLVELSRLVTDNRDAIRALVRASQNTWEAD